MAPYLRTLLVNVTLTALLLGAGPPAAAALAQAGGGADGWKVMAPVDLQGAAEAGLRTATGGGGAAAGQPEAPPASEGLPPGVEAQAPEEPPAAAPPAAAPPAPPARPAAAPSARPKPAGPAYMAEDQPFKLRDYEEPKLEAEAPWWQQTGGLILKLVVVIGLMLAALAFVRKVGGGKLPMGLAVGKGRNLVVLESTSLGPQHSMHLVSVGGDRLIVVGSSPQGLSTLATIDDPTQAAMLLAASRGQNTSFNQMYDMETVMQGPGGDAFRGALTDLGRRGGWD
ncbi:MAG: flagellar biosynthetic protein FliO [Candidatus Sericytochromatia bacterium]|nr:flagellar biosynthetic protein FliO [Candidatus Sericytochromatia bacterium]